jgi:ATP-dependent Clp protease ATP-binding subunit ClpA
MSKKKRTSKKKVEKKSISNIIKPWLELDLTAAARADELQPAYEVDEYVEMVGGLLDAGRSPVLMGAPGVGKTAIVHELVRRAHAGRGPARLRGARVYQVSLQRRASSLKESHMLGQELQELVEALRQSKGKIALFFRDLYLAYDHDLEPQFAALAYAFRGVVIGEGPESAVTTLLECDQYLRQHFLTVRIDEPTLDRARVILRMWAQGRREKSGQAFSTGAIEQALLLSDRFLTRDCLPRKAVEILEQCASLAAGKAVIRDHDVFERFCVTQQTPRALMDPSVPLKIDRVRQHFAERVVGQDDAVDAVVRMISIIKSGLSDVRRPIGVLLFVGPTGVGKTYVAQLLTEHLFGHRDRMVRLNMADYQDPYAADLLFGKPNADYTRQEVGTLTQRLLCMPFGVVLLDEFEKAHASVHDRFLQLFDEGTFINGKPETVSCRSWILVATSNAGWEASPVTRLGFTSGELENRRGRAEIAIQKYFRPELLNRFDRIVQFLPLEVQALRELAAREINRISERTGIEQRRLVIQADSAVIDWVAEKGRNSDEGARCLRRTIEGHVTSALAELIARENPSPGSRLALSVVDDRVIARLAGLEDAPGTSEWRASTTEDTAAAYPAV